MVEQIIKWSGSKRSIAREIVNLLPLKIKTYYEPFIGGGAVMYQILHSRRPEAIICSDINPDLITLWNAIKTSPNVLIKHYEQLWNELYSIKDINAKKEFYYKIRERFNEEREPGDFLFISRTTMNGLIRYNTRNEFNSSFHFSRDGIEPHRLNKILMKWHSRLNYHNVKFLCCDYRKIVPEDGDFVYLDPPYAGTKGMYYCTIGYDELWSWMRMLKCSYILSFDGISGKNNRIYPVPNDLFDSHILIKSGCSSFKRLKVNPVIEQVRESLYIRHNHITSDEYLHSSRFKVINLIEA